MGKAVKPKWYAIKRPDGTFIMNGLGNSAGDAWYWSYREDDNLALATKYHVGICTLDPRDIVALEKIGYRCVEVVGFKEAGE